MPDPLSTDSAATPSFTRDSRGNRLVGWTCFADGGIHFVRLCGPSEVADQLAAVAPEYQRLQLVAEARAGWTHLFRAPGRELAPRVRRLLDLLQTVISLPSRPAIDAALALDWYKVADDAVDPTQWANTASGDLVNQGKYRSRYDAARQDEVGGALADRLCSTIEAHAGLLRATTILDVPGHDGTRVSLVLGWPRRSPGGVDCRW